MRRLFTILLMSFLTGQLQAQFTDTVTFKDNNEKWGIKVLSTKKVLVEPKYQDLGDPNEGLIRARLNDKTGFIDLNGKVIVPFKYHDANYFAEGLAAVSQETKSGWKIGFVDKSGKLVIELKYYSMSLDRTRFYNGVAVVAKGSKNEFGLIDKTGRELTPFIYTGINLFENSIGITAASKSGKWALLDKTGKELTPFKYDGIENPYYFSGGLIKMEVGGKFGFVDYTGKEIVPPYFEEAGNFSEDLCAVRSGSKWGYIDKKGENVLRYQYDIANSFSEGLALIVYINQEDGNNNWKCIDKSGKIIFSVKGGQPTVYGYFIDGLLLLQNLEEKYFFIGKTGVPISAEKYDYAEEFSEGLAGVCIDGKCGYIDTAGKLVIPLKYTITSPFNKGYAAVNGLSENGDEITFIIDKAGKVVTSY
jgi:hypothetical protein